MQGDADTITVTPSPERLINSLTNLGHSFETAVADLIDNSIEAGATEIEIYVRFDGPKSAVRISDNGRGMTPEVMKEAMRFGTNRDYGSSDLGKFGLGLKTASLSQSRKFTVASRLNHGGAEVHAMSWDMDHLENSREWEVLKIGEDNLDTNIRKPLDETPGTVIYWSQINSLFDYKDPGSVWAKKRLLKMCRELEGHLAMVFHRFLSNGVGCKTINIKLNGNDINAWDPFARDEQHTKAYEPVLIEVKEGSATGQVEVVPFILPRKDQFSSQEAFQRTSGPANWNQQQGFYIYRAERMIQSGGWCDTRTVDEHTKLARIGLHFSPDLDDAFNIDVTKMSVNLPASLIEKLGEHTIPVVKSAQEIYRGKKPKPGSGQKSTKRGISLRAFDKVTDLLREVAQSEETPVIEEVIRRAREREFGRG